MRRLVSLTSTHGKTTAEAAQEAYEAFTRYEAAQARAAEAQAQATPTGPPPEGDEPADSTVRS